MTINLLKSIIVISIGIIILIIGYMLKYKTNISLIHYHKNINKNERNKYAKEIGNPVMFIGNGVIFSGILKLFKKDTFSLVIFMTFVIIGLFCIKKIQDKYNAEWF